MPFSYNRCTVASKSKGKLNYKAVFERYGNQFNFPMHLAGAFRKSRSDFMPQNTTLPVHEICMRKNQPNNNFPKR